MSEGYIALHRKILDWEWYRDINVTRVFIHLLLTANHKENKWQGMIVERGQKITSLGNLALETRLSVRQIRVCLDKLKMTSEITIKTTNRFSVITINNYDYYQSNNKQAGKQMTNKGQTNDKQMTTNNNDNNVNNENKNKTHLKEDITKDEVLELSRTLGLTPEGIISYYQRIKDYELSVGKKYKNYPATIRNWVRRARSKQ